jgi:membrane protein required for colicin V production
MADLPITFFDIVVALVLLLSTLVALARGMVREIVGLASWVGAFVVAYYAFQHARPFAKEVIGNEMLTDIATAASVFLVPLIVFKILGGMLASGVDEIGLGLFDRVGGMLFGVARGALLVCIGWLVVSMVLKPEQQPVWVRQAYLLPYVEAGGDWLRGFLPERLAEDGRAAAERAGDGARRLGAVRDALGSAREPEPPPRDGYTDEQRRQMDRLFQPGG